MDLLLGIYLMTRRVLSTSSISDNRRQEPSLWRIYNLLRWTKCPPAKHLENPLRKCQMVSADQFELCDTSGRGDWALGWKTGEGCLEGVELELGEQSVGWMQEAELANNKDLNFLLCLGIGKWKLSFAKHVARVNAALGCGPKILVPRNRKKYVYSQANTWVLAKGNSFSVEISALLMLHEVLSLGPWNRENNLYLSQAS